MISSPDADTEPAMWGSATMAMVESSAVMIVASMIETRIMPRLGAGHGPVILDADQERTTMPVRKAHHCFNQVAIVESSPLIALKLNLVPFTGGSPPRNLLGQIPGWVRPNHRLDSLRINISTTISLATDVV